LQMTQTAACSRYHTQDRHSGNELVMMRKRISNMLGVLRESVAESACKLKKLGLIHYSRGRITVLDRPALENRSCECYAVVKKEYKCLLPAGRPPGPPNFRR